MDNEFEGCNIEYICEILARIAKNCVAVCHEIIKSYPNKHVVHLALHGHGLTRKKNIRRILKDHIKKLKRMKQQAVVEI